MKIIILFPNSFPIGVSSTNRVIHIAKAIIEGGFSVEVIITRGTERKNSIINTDTFGSYEGIPYIYSNRSTMWPENKVKRLLNVLLGIFRTIRLLIHNKSKIDFLLSYADYSFFNNFILFLFCKFYKIKFIYAVDEYPWSLIYKEKYSRIYHWVYIKFFYRLFDGMIVMTKKLLGYYSNKIKKGCKLFHLPMTVETERFTKRSKNHSNYEYIAYCGGEPENYNKDGVNILIEAFSILSPKFIDLKLFIIGKTNKTWLNQVETLKLKGKVIFKGKVHRNEIPDYLINAKILALARPSNTQADGGFPTKLGEYLATGNPVIVTNVGEISSYLKDEINAFLVSPNDPYCFAEKLEFILNNYEYSKEVGLRGRMTAFSHFNYQRYIDDLKHFFMKI